MGIVEELEKTAELIRVEGVTVNSDRDLLKAASDMKIAILLAKIKSL